MLNTIMLVGRLVKKPEVVETETGKQRSQITIAVPRSYKNSDGIYETDFVDCVLWDGVASSAMEYCNKGDLVGIRGRIQTNNYETEDGEKRKSTVVVTDKLSFLSSNFKDKSDDKSKDDDLDM